MRPLSSLRKNTKIKDVGLMLNLDSGLCSLIGHLGKQSYFDQNLIYCPPLLQFFIILFTDMPVELLLHLLRREANINIIKNRLNCTKTLLGIKIKIIYAALLMLSLDFKIFFLK